MLVKLSDNEISTINGGAKLFITGTIMTGSGAILNAAKAALDGHFEEAGKPDAIFSSKRIAKTIALGLDITSCVVTGIGTLLIGLDRGKINKAAGHLHKD